MPKCGEGPGVCVCVCVRGASDSVSLSLNFFPFKMGKLVMPTSHSPAINREDEDFLNRIIGI